MAVSDDETIRFTDSGTRDALIGALVDDYEVKDRVGQGAMGIVYRGVHRVIGKTVAIKVLKIDFADDPGMVNRLIGEARTVNAIRHPGIVDIFGFGTLRTGQPYIVMDMLEGEPLDVFIKRNAPLKIKEVWPILDDILGALGAAHQVGVIHRDLKPGNVFRESHPEARSRIKVIDFGLARTADRANGSIRPTNPGTLLGTPAFMAPEQVTGTKVTPATDLYALGGIAYQLLTAHFPHEAVSAIEVLTRKMAEDPKRPKAWVPGLDEELDAWVMGLLEREAERRPQSAEEARRALRRIYEGRTSTNDSVQAVRRSSPSRPPVAQQRGWSDARTLVDQSGISAPIPMPETTTDRDDSPFAATQESPAARAKGAIPAFGPTPLPHKPEAASLGGPAAVRLPSSGPGAPHVVSAIAAASPRQASDTSRTVPIAGVSDEQIASHVSLHAPAPRQLKHHLQEHPLRKPTKSIVPLVVAALVALALLTAAVFLIHRQ